MSTKLSLEEIYASAQKSSLRKDGSRDYVHPADVRGRWTLVRRSVFAVLIVLYVVLPWIRIGGNPAVFLDLPRRQFFLFGLTFNAQDFWLAFFVLSAVGFLLIAATALLGRIWCGYACPQTVWLDGVFRRFERWIEGPRNERIRRNQGPWNFPKLWRKLLKHGIFLTLSTFIAHVLLSYFVSIPKLFVMLQAGPTQHPEAFGWVFVITAAFYFNFAWFREQLCLIICPYGRLQSVITDTDSVVIGYDALRGEPRGKRRLVPSPAEQSANTPSSGDCIDCRRCVVVCPTGIDIRNGLQLDCIGCANCVDACDEIMVKIGKPKGLVRYDSLQGLEGKAKRFWRPRLFLYAAFGCFGIAAGSLALYSYTPFESNLLRASTAPYTVSEGSVRNTFVLHLVNKSPDVRAFEVSASVKGMEQAKVNFHIPNPRLSLQPLKGIRMPVSVVVDQQRVKAGTLIHLQVKSGAESKQVSASLLGPRL